MHVERTRQLRAGVTLTQFTMAMARRLGIAATIAPMSDDRVSTIVETEEGRLPFQRYFVERRCEPVLRNVVFENARNAKPSAAALAALRDPDLAAVLICPSNPYLSVDPILAVPDMREAIRASAAPVVAVSPLVGGRAIKGPTTKIMSELGLKADPSTIARHYDGLIDGLVVDDQDKTAGATVAVTVCATATLMQSLEDRERLAAVCVAFAEDLALPTRARKARHA
jgi:LPPG:FO 2-phospho-L-lactate transferase